MLAVEAVPSPLIHQKSDLDLIAPFIPQEETKLDLLQGSLAVETVPTTTMPPTLVSIDSASQLLPSVAITSEEIRYRGPNPPDPIEIIVDSSKKPLELSSTISSPSLHNFSHTLPTTDSSTSLTPNVFKEETKLKKILRMGFFGLCSFTLFLSFSIFQGFVTALFGGSGFISLALVYITFAFGSLIAPFIAEKLSSRRAMLVASVSYLLWMISIATRLEWLMFPFSALLGIGGGLFWVSNGVYLMEGAEGPSKGMLSGIYWTLHYLSFPGGSGLAMLLLVVLQLELLTMLWIFFGVACFGVFLFIFLLPPPAKPNFPSTPPMQKIFFFQSIKKTFQIFGNKKTRVLLPSMMFQGANAPYVFGLLPTFMRVDIITYFFLSYGVATVFGAFFGGKLLDKKYGWQMESLFNFFFSFSGYVCTILAVVFSNHFFFFVGGACLGLGDALTMCIIPWAFMNSFTAEESGSINSSFRFIASATTGLGFFLSLYMPAYVMASLLSLLILLATLGYFYLFYRLNPLTPAAQKVTELPKMGNEWESIPSIAPSA